MFANGNTAIDLIATADGGEAATEGPGCFRAAPPSPSKLPRLFRQEPVDNNHSDRERSQRAYQVVELGRSRVVRWHAIDFMLLL